MSPSCLASSVAEMRFSIFASYELRIYATRELFGLFRAMTLAKARMSV
jgi:hypothetical protein